MRGWTWMLLALLGLSLPMAAATDQEKLDRLLERATELRLAESRGWLDLLHYDQRRVLPGKRSGTRDPAFFLASDGWRDPEAELQATLRGLFQPVEPDSDEQHPQCAFIARYHWLKEQLEIDPGDFPEAPCQRYQEWIEAINPGAVTIVFADAYMNNPASMYGHTLLRVDPPGEDSSRLLSYVINHAADTDETSGLVFAVRGLTGGYPGRFSVMPYYEKVQEYNHLENRDLWEYELALDQDEVDQMMRHVWELRGIAFPYYFLHQNCSYRLLKLLEVARPGLTLSDRFSWWATPTDTIRVALEPEGMLADTRYRPASRTRLEHQLDGLDDEEIDQVRRLLEDGPEGLAGNAEPERQQVMLESAHDLLHYRMEAGDEVQRERLRSLLVARSELGPPPDSNEPPTPDTRPDEGHSTLRLGFGGGRRDDANHIGLHWRPAYHDLLDPAPGYRDGAHISFGDTRLLYDLDRDRLQLDRLRLVDVESLVPREPFFQSRSWHIGGGLEQRLRPQGGYGLQTGLEGGGGFSWLAGDNWLFYAGLRGAAWGAAHLDDTVRAGLGPRLDLLYGGERWRTRLRAEGGAFTDHQFQWRLALEQDLSLNRHLGLRLSASREQDFDHHVNRVDLILHWYIDP
ncbi:DUF4105 domain-containing protein [Methylonatrum kenyense]|uniref:Lnb N-terminal periplasmic domain-containing protein n=1 Tax=Methylonatrum kenyense TaxID=455253 RepID=UPI0020BE5220|nr:DUF4105 domain-containing protein [Methylonatrum kenyense]MCK8515442.1 DUF4105 domain-containing protein [Methylonatrum kenyense]